MSEKLDNNYNSIEDNYGFLTKNGPRPIGSLNLNNAINYFIKEFSGLNISPEDLLAKDNIIYLGIEPNRIDFFNAQGDLDFDTSFRTFQTP